MFGLLGRDLRVSKIINKNMNQLTKEIKRFVNQQWNEYRPEYFITLTWNDLPTQFETASGHAKQFKNIFLTKLYKLRRVGQLPDFPKRIGITCFQERKDVYVGSRSFQSKRIRSFHTHMHLMNPEELPVDLNVLNEVVGEYCAPRIEKLTKIRREGNKGFDIRPWVSENHRHYNFKDYYSGRYLVDGDLVLDYEVSDFACSDEQGSY